MTDTDLIADKRAALAGLRAIADASPATVGRAIADIYHADAEWRGSHPLNELRGVDAIESVVWRPLLEAMPDLERRDVIFIGGEWEGARLIGAVGNLMGSFARDWLGIRATGRAMLLRYGEYHVMRDGKIAQSTVLFDLLDFIRQTGHWPLAPMLGAVEMWPAPVSADGIVLTAQDPAESAASIKLVLDMHETINSYDDNKDNSRAGLLNMRQKNFWHPKMMWYGPAGIGAARGLEGYVDVHQLPFRRAYPNRIAIGHYARFGDGKYAATGGWPSVRANHVGGNWLGLPPTGRSVTMRVMDFYLCDGGLIRENWVPLDMLDLLLQMDVDVLGRMASSRHAGM